jgi:hypothetical protein
VLIWHPNGRLRQFLCRVLIEWHLLLYERKDILSSVSQFSFLYSHQHGPRAHCPVYPVKFDMWDTRGCIQKFPDWVDNEINIATTINTHWEATQRVMVAKLTMLAHKMEIQPYLVAESCIICSYRCRRSVRELLIHHRSSVHHYPYISSIVSTKSLSVLSTSGLRILVRRSS